jgi:hypothetical protein
MRGSYRTTCKLIFRSRPGAAYYNDIEKASHDEAKYPECRPGGGEEWATAEGYPLRDGLRAAIGSGE